MGSERFVGNNAAHDTSKSSKASKGGWEGIYANLSLSGLMGAVDAAARTPIMLAHSNQQEAAVRSPHSEKLTREA